MNRALLVGITDYKEKPLNGCVNDVNDVKDFLVNNCGFTSEEITCLINKEATQKNIITELEKLVTNVNAFDRLLFFYSGHGSQVTSISKDGEVDGLDEIICPIDIKWTNETIIRDKDFNRIFSALKPDVLFTWISDSCNSGDLIKFLSQEKEVAISKTLPPPRKVAKKIHMALEKQAQTSTLLKIANNLNVTMISACRSDQSSLDTIFSGRYNGVLTYYLLEQLKKGYQKGNNITKVFEDIKSEISTHAYEQVPQLEGSEFLRNRPFLR